MEDQKYREAVEWARIELPEKVQDYHSLEQAVVSDERWWVPIHLHFGMWFRNRMRDAGFTDQVMGCNLDDIYVNIINEAVLGEPRPLDLSNTQIFSEEKPELKWEEAGF